MAYFARDEFRYFEFLLKAVDLFLKILGHFYGTPRPDDIDENSTGINDLRISDKENEGNSTDSVPPDMVNAMTILPPVLEEDRLGPLPPNWEVAYSELGEKYFIE